MGVDRSFGGSFPVGRNDTVKRDSPVPCDARFSR